MRGDGDGDDDDSAHRKAPSPSSTAEPVAEEDFEVIHIDKHAKRVRLLSSYLQVIANELCRRTRNASANGTACGVRFEPGVRQFAINSTLISQGDDPAASWQPPARGAKAHEIALPAGASCLSARVR